MTGLQKSWNLLVEGFVEKLLILRIAGICANAV